MNLEIYNIRSFNGTRRGVVYGMNALSVRNYAFVDRSTPFGNPFVINNWDEVRGRWGIRRDRDECIKLYREWIENPQQEWLRAKIKAELAGKHLVCWCAPLPCHAEIIMDIANEDTGTDQPPYTYEDHRGEMGAGWLGPNHTNVN